MSSPEFRTVIKFLLSSHIICIGDESKNVVIEVYMENREYTFKYIRNLIPGEIKRFNIKGSLYVLAKPNASNAYIRLKAKSIFES